MKKRIVFMNDILFHSTENKNTWHTWIANLINPAIKLSCNEHIVLFTDLTNHKNEYFNRNKFYELSGIYNVPVSYYSYDMDQITKESWDYLFSFIKKDDFVLGCELGLDLRKKLTEEQYTFINFWFHSFKLFDDICFMLNTNDAEIFNKIKQFQIPKEKFELYAFITKRRLRDEANNLKIKDNSCLFIAQSMKDKSLEKDGKYLNITDFSDQIENIIKKYNRIYYVPHPYCPVERKSNIYNFIKKRPYIEILTGIPTYTLLSSPKVKSVTGISSSVLYEATFFDKDVQYLYRPLFDIDAEFGNNTYISVYNDYLDPRFWITVLDKHFIVNKNNIDIQLFDKRKSVLRGETLNGYHGYKSLDQYKFLCDKIDELQNRSGLITRLLKKIIGS